MANKPNNSKPRIVVVGPRRPGWADEDVLGRPAQPHRNPQRVDTPGRILGPDAAGQKPGGVA